MALPELNTARYTMVLPSTGETIEYRPYLVKEEKILMMAMESDDQEAVMKAIVDVIKACLLTELNVDELPMFDIETLFLALRSKSVGESVDLKVKCTTGDCQEVSDVKVNFDDIEQPVVGEEQTKIMLTDDVGVVMKYPSVGSVATMANADENADNALKMIIKCIDSIFDADDVYPVENETEKSLLKFIESLNSVQFYKLSDFFNDMPSLSTTIDWTCSCGKKQSKELRGLASFFT
tara:strand:+ start:1533 stop:2240 length:708 start_codon:yes stop_codon:yes gene_type:complete